MRRSESKADDLLTIKKAAELLEVSEQTLRRWDRLGKFTAYRHPANGYRLYRRKALEAFYRRLRGSGAEP